jgi:iron complex outermembrane receptor protein
MKQRRTRKNTIRLHGTAGLAALAASVMIGAPAHAQTADSGASARTGNSDPIVVTARRREENLLDVPVSVTAFGAQELEARSFSDISDLSGTVPNVNFDAGTNSLGSGAAASIYIRGIGQDDFLPTSDPGVGVYLDGVYLGRTVGQVLSAIDIERLEVLRGPQGTLFGRNTIGGAINVTLRRPQEEVTGFVRAQYGTDNLFDIAGRADLPVSDMVRTAFTAGYRRRDGIATSPNAPGIDFGDEDKFTLRGQISILPSSSVRIDLVADWFRQREETEPAINYGADFANPNTLGAFYNGFAPLVGAGQYTPADITPLSRPFDTQQTGPSRDDLDVWGVAGTITWDVSDSVTLKSITAYRELQANFANDNDATIHPIAFIDEQIDQNQFSQEFQLLADFGSVDLVAGLYYFDERAMDDNLIPIVPGLFAALGQLPGAIIPLAPYPTDPGGNPLFTCPAAPAGFPCAGGPGNPLNVALDQTIEIFGDIDVENYAAYAHANFDIAGGLSASLGARITHEEKTFFAFQQRIESSAALGMPIYNLSPRESSDSWTEFTPHLGLQYEFDNGHLIYASYDRGFRSGTFNGRANSAVTFSAVDPETVDAYEIGFKGEFFGGTTRLSLAAFYNDYQDIQLRAVIPSTTGLDVFLINAAGATIKGFEAELYVAPSPYFRAGGTFGYAHSEIDEVDPIVAQFTGIVEGNVLTKTPEVTFSIFAQHDFELAGGLLSIRADYNWRDSVFHDAANTVIPGVGSTREGSYGLLDARISYTSVDECWEIALWGRNLTDETRFATLFANAGGQLVAYPVRDREIGVSGTIRF